MDVKANISTESVQLDRIRPIGEKRIDPQKDKPKEHRRRAAEREREDPAAREEQPAAGATGLEEQHILDVRV